MKPCAVLAALVCVSLLWARDAHAYIDPGTGSYVLQIIIAGLVGAIVSVKVFFHRIRAAVGSRFRGARKETPKPDDT